MKILSLIFLAVIVALQYPIWFGKGGWNQVHDMETQLTALHQKADTLKSRNDALAAEVANLKNENGSLEAVEEHARNDLGLVKKDEIYFQLQPRK